MPPTSVSDQDAESLADPEVRLALTARSGPLVVEIEYRVSQDNARAFHNLMQDVQLSRQRNGPYCWSIARDIANLELWTERYHWPTWLDYLRQRNRLTESERALDRRAVAFHVGPAPARVRSAHSDQCGGRKTYPIALHSKSCPDSAAADSVSRWLQSKHTTKTA
ncbi:hypothetical protein GCM10007857_88130 [Bradyrhizobium iriomotense]|uniref:Antibiotic biosynthesis monooxygenase n=1 Tax=Bradyrhizobium iriomotense TaxID=441950 RepID=A0ABQ6BCI4_9BRAD|nr:hypothetical protein GCM10007857_88130 [Bradyrhizobium iriomotense]